MTSPVDVYGEDLLTCGTGAPATTWMLDEDGRRTLLDLPRWTASPRGADLHLLERCTGSTLDIGCGPGRLTRGLVRMGLPCLGVDVAPVAVAMARLGGTPVLHASVYDAVLDGAVWDTVLLADENVGIGGDPVALLARCRQLLAPGGRVLVELEPPSTRTRLVRVRIDSSSGRTSRWFPWAHVSAADAADVAARAGLDVVDRWQESGRWFAELRSSTEPQGAA